MEALRCYRPTNIQLEFHQSGAPERVVRGGKRSGKTVSCSAEFASAVTGMPIIAPDGKPVKRHYPKKNMLCWVIGFDLTHIGQTIYRNLFEPGIFMVLPVGDGTWRTMNPANAEDKARAAEAHEAGPMIPPRFIVPGSWSWESRAERVFKGVTVRNPWGDVRIHAFPSTAQQAKQGDAVDLIWIDEDVRFSQHVAEWQDRLADKGGRLFWSAWPHGSNDALVRMSERAAECAMDDNPPIKEVVLRFSDNPFIEDIQKQLSIGRMTTEEDRRSRDYGEYLFDAIAMYEFLPNKHCIYKLLEDDPYSKLRQADRLNQIYTELGEFPDTWTRYLSVDPSHTRSAVIFGVVPPPEYEGFRFGKMLIIENELVMKKAGAAELAGAVLPLVERKQYEAFIMDQNMGRQTRVGSSVGNTVMALYEEEFAKRGIKSRLTGSSFLPGTNDVTARAMEVRKHLAPDRDGIIRLRVVADKTYHLQKEFGSYRKKAIMGQVLDEPANARTHDAAVAMEYLMSYIANCPEPYVDPSIYRRGNPVLKHARELLKKWNRSNTDSYCHVGPGASI